MLRFLHLTHWANLDLFETKSGEADGRLLCKKGAFLCSLHCSNKLHVCLGSIQQLKVAWLLLSVDTVLLSHQYSTLYLFVSRFCKDVFDKNYKATIGVDFEMERFEVLGVPFSLQLWVWRLPSSVHSNRVHWTSHLVSLWRRWDTAGQERFKCIASTYYRGAQGEGFIQQWPDEALIKTLGSGFFFFSFSCHHRIWCQWYRLFLPCEVSVFISSCLCCWFQFVWSCLFLSAGSGWKTRWRRTTPQLSSCS